jgi:hypothetical protein
MIGLRLGVAGTLCATLCLAGCQTGEQRQAIENAGLDTRLSAYEKKSIAQFIGKTGMTPIDFYPVLNGRVFVFQGRTTVMTLPATAVTPQISNAYACRLLVKTVASGQRGTADDWKIIGTSRSGPCRDLPV